MKTIYVFITGICASVLLISSSIIKPQDATKGTPCDDTNRYERMEASGGGGRIAETAACNMITAFAKRTGFNRGGFISKRALDKIFSGTNNNGINFYFAMDTSSESKIVKLIIEGTHQATTQTEALNSTSDRYISQIICPPACSAAMVKCQ